MAMTPAANLLSPQGPIEPGTDRGLMAFCRDHAAFVVLLIVISLVMTIMQRRVAFLNIFESGVYYAGGQRVLAGQVPYRDFFLLYGPFVPYSSALALHLTRNPLDAEWLHRLSLTLITATLAYAVAGQLGTRRWARLIPPLAAAGYANSGARMFLPLICLLFIGSFLNRPRGWKLFAAGLAAGVSLFVLQDLPVYITAAIGLWCAVLLLIPSCRPPAIASRDLLRGGALFAAGLVAGIVPFLVALYAAGALGAFRLDVFVIPLHQYATRTFTRFPSIFSTPEGPVSTWQRLGWVGVMIQWSLLTLPFYFIPATYLVTIIHVLLTRSRRPADSLRLLLSIFGLGMFRTVVMVPDEPHLLVNSLPAALLLSVWLSQLATPASAVSASPSRRAIASLGLCAAAFFCVYGWIHTVIHHRHPVPLGLPSLVTRSTVNIEWPDIHNAVEYIRAHSTPTQSVFCGPTCPMISVLAGRLNPTRYDYLDPIITPAVEDDLLAELEHTRPALCVRRNGTKIWGEVFGQQFGLRTNAWLNLNYEHAASYGDYEILRARESQAVVP